MGVVATGYLASAAYRGWQTAIYVWAGWAFAGAAIMAILWNTTPNKVGVLPGYVPKMGAMAALLAAGAALRFGGHPLALQVLTVAAIGSDLASFTSRVAAAAALAIAAVGLLSVFIRYVRGASDVTWPESAAMVAFGLALITTLMILVERGGEATVCE